MIVRISLSFFVTFIASFASAECVLPTYCDQYRKHLREEPLGTPPAAGARVCTYRRDGNEYTLWLSCRATHRIHDFPIVKVEDRGPDKHCWAVRKAEVNRKVIQEWEDNVVWYGVEAIPKTGRRFDGICMFDGVQPLQTNEAIANIYP